MSDNFDDMLKTFDSWIEPKKQEKSRSKYNIQFPPKKTLEELDFVPLKRSFPDEVYEKKEYYQELLSKNIEEYHLLSETLRNDPEVFLYTFKLILNYEPTYSRRKLDLFSEVGIRYKTPVYYEPYLYRKVFYKSVGNLLKDDKKFFLKFIKENVIHMEDRTFPKYNGLKFFDFLDQNFGMSDSLASDEDIINEIFSNFIPNDLDYKFIVFLEKNSIKGVKSMISNGYYLNLPRSGLELSKHIDFSQCYCWKFGGNCNCTSYFWIKSAKGDINTNNDDNDQKNLSYSLSPFQYVCVKNMKEMIKSLLILGGNVYTQNEFNDNCFELMKFFGHDPSILDYFIPYQKTLYKTPKDIYFNYPNN